MVGKWHLGFYKWPYVPTNRGFDSAFGYLDGAEDHYDHKVSDVVDFRNGTEPVLDLNGKYATFEFVKVVCDNFLVIKVYNTTFVRLGTRRGAHLMPITSQYRVRIPRKVYLYPNIIQLCVEIGAVCVMCLSREHDISYTWLSLDSQNFTTGSSNKGALGPDC